MHYTTFTEYNTKASKNHPLFRHFKNLPGNWYLRACRTRQEHLSLSLSLSRKILQRVPGICVYTVEHGEALMGVREKLRGSPVR
jgi:hypothetical protein